MTQRPKPSSLAEPLLKWYRKNRRDLPWRRMRDPYAIWVSEVMLQQTRVTVVQERFPPFLARFPDLACLAEADDDALLTAWQGLGYYRRVRHLRDAAKEMVAGHDGQLPRCPAAFGKLPGVGPYTKGAVLSIAFNQPLPAIDGNVERVLCRFLTLAIHTKNRKEKAPLQEFVQKLHRLGSPSEINQALMELGALVCTPQNPDCESCPWHDSCRARQTNQQEAFPLRHPAPRITAVTTKVCLCRRGGAILARRIPSGEVNEGQLCLPGLGLPLPKGKDLSAHLRKAHGLHGKLGPCLTTISHSITRYKIQIKVYALNPPPPQKAPGKGLIYADIMDHTLPWSSITKKVMHKWTLLSMEKK